MAEEDIREIKIIKVPREKPPVVWSTNTFKELDVNSLGLNHLEIKHKLKPNPPTLKSVPSTPKETPKQTTPSPPKEKSSKPKSKKTATEDELIKAFAESREASEKDESDSSEEDEDSEEDESDSSEEEDEESEEGGVEEKPKKSSKKASQSESSSLELEVPVDLEGSENEEVEEALQEPKTVIEEAAPEETEEQKKRKIVRRLRTLKKIYPSANIPDFDYDDDVELMNRTLEDVTYDMKVDQNVSMYRTFLLGYFSGTEFLAGFLDYDMVGFASSQYKIMNHYNSLLVELAEKNQESWVSNLPVEVRLLGLIVLNTAVYFLFRYIYNTKGAAAGHAFMGIYDNLTSYGPSHGESSTPSGNSVSGASASPAPKPKAFKPPSVDIDKLKEEVGSSTESDSEEDD